VEVKRKPPVELITGRMELDGHILAAEGKYKQAMSELNAASNAQRKIRYTEPPQYPRPVNEAIGEIALKAGKYSDAEAAFRVALQDLPGSKRSVNGLDEAMKHENKSVGGAAN
jgi:Tfp pilus assembly protein PilF